MSYKYDLKKKWNTWGGGGGGRVPVLKHLILQYFFIYVNYINHTI